MDLKTRLKPVIRWAILGGTLFFLAKVLKENWEGVTALRVAPAGWACLAIALGVTILAHICAGWVWSQMLRQDFQQPVKSVPLIQSYLQSTIAKYLPGNIWHYYGRIKSATHAGASVETATLSTLLEPLLMAAAALVVTLLSSRTLATRFGSWALIGQGIALASVLAALHPKVLNQLLRVVAKLKKTIAFQINHYPVFPLVGELGFLLLRGFGFLLTVWALSPFDLTEALPLLSGFSLAWLLGLVVPGAPGGVGVFETTAIALLGNTHSLGLLLGIVAVYRLVSVLAEAIAAGLSYLDRAI
jgi:glycosyltransferase 2 family protein